MRAQRKQRRPFKSRKRIQRARCGWHLGFELMMEPAPDKFEVTPKARRKTKR